MDLTTATVPVSPYVAPYDDVDNVVLSLVGLADPKFITLTADTQAAPYSSLNYTLQQTSLDVMLELGFSSASSFSAKAEGNTFFFLSDLTANKAVGNTDPDSVIEQATFSVGVRIGVFAFGMDSKFAADAFSVAAAATLHMASTAYQVLVIGTGLETVDALVPLITNSTGAFSVETLQTIGAVEAGIQRLLSDEQEKLVPELTAVTIDIEKLAAVLSAKETTSFFDLLVAHTFTMERVYRWNTAAQAASDAPSHGVSADLVTQAYQELFGLSGEQPVTSEDYDLVNELLFAGRN